MQFVKRLLIYAIFLNYSSHSLGYNVIMKIQDSLQLFCGEAFILRFFGKGISFKCIHVININLLCYKTMTIEK